MSDIIENAGEGDDFDVCPHGLGFDEECEDCEAEDAAEDEPALMPSQKEFIAKLAKLEAMRTHCENCGADYMATGIEARCPCQLIAQNAKLIEALKKADEGLKLAYKVPRPWISGGISYDEWEKCCQTIDEAHSVVRSALRGTATQQQGKR